MSDVATRREQLPAAISRPVIVPDYLGRYWLARYWPELSGAVAARFTAALFLKIEPCPDVAWQLWIGHQLRHGARFYVDIIETNPPLWFWMAMPIDWLAGLLGTGPVEPMIMAMGTSSALSVVAVGRLLGGIAHPVRAILLVYVALTLMLMPSYDVGQREQILLICAVPYAILAASRYEGRASSVWLAVAIGVAGALGFALKHYFLIAPALIELWLLAALRRRYRPVRPETAALVAVGLSYAAAVMVLTPAYLRNIVPMLRLTYGALQVRHAADMISVIQAFWLMLVALLLLRFNRLVRTPAATALTITAVGFAAAWLVQFKGWHNHAVPTTGCLMIAVAVLIAVHWRTLHSHVWVAAPMLLVAPFVFSALATPYRDPIRVVTRPMLVGLGKDDSVAFVSEFAVYAWPLTLTRGFRYPSRHYGMWMMTGVIADGARSPALPYARKVVDETAQDYSCAQPERIVFDQHDRGGFDMEGFFRSSARFEQVMHHYRRIGRYRSFDIYQRIAPFPMPPADTCRRGV